MPRPSPASQGMAAPSRQAACDADYEAGRANVRVAQIPASVCRHRHHEIGKAYAANLVAVVVHVGDERGELFARYRRERCCASCLASGP